jgi:hypothetical protein
MTWKDELETGPKDDASPRPRPLFADFVRAQSAVRPRDPQAVPLLRFRTTPPDARTSVWRRLGRRLWGGRV